MHTRTKRNIRKLAAGISAFAVLAMPLSVGATANTVHPSATNYKAHLQELNNTGVTGMAHLQHHMNGHNNHELRVNLKAHGTQANMVHPVHIHGNEHPEVAFCPSNAQDTNDDGFVSVIEGAATYGPIKLNLTSPQTPFGAPPTLALFTPFAGTAEMANFPMADGAGNVHQNQTYVFDNSEAAQGALATLMPLENQHIVIHGADAPASVDAAAFKALGLPVGDPKAIIYDPVFPIACGAIEKVSHQNQNQHHNKGNDQNNNQHQNVNRNQNNTNDHQAQNQNNGQNQQHANNDRNQGNNQDHNQVQNNQHQNNGGRGQQAEHTVAPTHQANQTAQHTEAVAVFHARMNELMQQYNTAKQAALQKYEAHKIINHAEARDHYIAAVQAARDQHVNHFYEARNMMVDQLNRSGHTQLRDETMRHAEQKLWQFTHDFEMMKQEFATKHND